MIVIPMAGLSRRFSDAGYALPKHQLALQGQTVFDHAVASFAHCFDHETFLFVLREDAAAEAFVRQALKRLGVRDARLHRLASPTRGQAETVALGLRGVGAKDEPVTIFNIDSIRHGYRPPAWEAQCDGWLEVFRADGDHWSFVQPQDGLRVARTTEKARISDLCSNGLYHFGSARLFDEAQAEAAAGAQFVRGELYVAPLYNLLIRRGLDIRYRCIDAALMDFCGVPAEYEQLLARGLRSPASTRPEDTPA